MDNLDMDAKRARAAHKTYGTWKAENPTTELVNAPLIAMLSKKGKKKQKPVKEPMHFICPICGAKFTASRHRVYCSDRCAKKANRRKAAATYTKRLNGEMPTARRYERTCVVCGKRFTAGVANAICCSDECRAERAKAKRKEREA